MKPLNKRTGLIAAAVALAAGGAGAAIAATQFDSPSSRSNAIVSDAAKQLGIEPGKLSAALKKAEEDQIDADVAAGRLTKEQADALKAAIEAGNVPLVGAPLKFGLGRGAFAVGLDTAASYLGLTTEQLRSELESGKTLAQIATEHGKSVDGLVSALVDAVKKQLDAAVSAGKLSSDQAQKIESDLQQRISDLVNGKLPALPPLGGMRLGLAGLGSAAASYLGVTEDQLRADLRSGKTLADVARDQGKSVDGLVSALVDAAKKQLDASVAAGRVSSSQAQKIESNLKETITDAVNGTHPFPGLGLGFGPFGGRGFAGPGFGFRGGPGLLLPGFRVA